MIKRVKLQNFQSHRTTELTLSPGVNVIIGSSDSGKTALFRALYWCIKNQWNGIDDISDWNRDKKGNPVKPSYVEIENDKNIIKRKRSKDFNGYVIDLKDKLEAIGRGVPEIVSNLLKINDVNIKEQFDSPFLLSDSSAEIARFFNKEIRLDLIDKILGKAESKRRNLNTLIFNGKNDIQELEYKLKDDFLFINDAEKLIGKIETINEVINESNNKINSIEKINSELKKINKKIASYKNINKAKEIVLSIDEIISVIKKTKEKINKIKSIVDEIKDKEHDINSYAREIKELKAKIPDVCPYCGSKIKE